ncbi:hypothetical protein DL98DRAFT_572758 [Cadophora sp. DSE1049]|nr:hypothetical protein DL98DRAFT_572758 [Cadophora sp. DSE1049]
MSGKHEVAAPTHPSSPEEPATDNIYGPDLATGLIRLLTLHPSTNSADQIRCTLTKVSLDDKPQYEALSYAWGLPGDERGILVNGHANTLERNHQVKQMGRVYKNTWRVLAWLGVEKDGSDEAMRFFASARSYDSREPKNRERIGLEMAHAIMALLNREYWQRLWIIQELLLARDARFYEHKIPLWDLFFEFSASQCLDARDKIYGLAALAAEMVDLEIDYSKSVTQKYVDVIGLRSYHSEAASLIVDFSQRLQTHLDQQVTTPDPPSIVTLISVVGSVGFGKGAITRFEPLEYRSVEDRRYAEGAKESVEAIVIPIFSGVSCGVQGGTLHGMCPSDGPHQRASKPWREVDDSLWTKLSMPIKQPNHDSSNTPPRLFISDKGGLGIAPGNAQVTDRIIGFWSSNVFAVIRWMGDRYIIGTTAFQTGSMYQPGAGFEDFAALDQMRSSWKRKQPTKLSIYQGHPWQMKIPDEYHHV